MSPRAPQPTPSAAVEATYALWLWLDARVVDWPTHSRPALGARVLDGVLTLLDHLTRAAFVARADPAFAALLREANHRVAFLRLLLRGAFERRYLAAGPYEHAATQLESVGRMIGGWLRPARARRPA